MQSNFSKCLAFTLKQEGGWSDNPRDPGGATMRGVTLATFSEWLGRQATKEELKAISDQQVQSIYKTKYWDTCKCDDLPAGIDLVVFDFSVNAGPSRAAKTLQGVCGIARDGLVGPMTLKALKEYSPTSVISDYNIARRDFYRGLASFQDFGKGWLRRVTDCDVEARNMVRP